MPCRLDDALGRTIELARPPERIVSLVASHTETLFALGLGDRVVGVTRYCVVPAARTRDLPKVGGTKRLDVDRIRELCPDLVVANKEENERADVERLLAEAFPVFVTFPRTVAEGVLTIRDLGRLTGREGEADEIVAPIEARIRAADANRPARRRVFCPVWRRPWVSANRDTFLHDMIEISGGVNVCGNLPDRYPRLSAGEIANLSPNVVLLPDEPYPFSDRDAMEIAERILPGFDRSRVHLVSGQLLHGYGPRMGEGIDRLRRTLGGDRSTSRSTQPPPAAPPGASGRPPGPEGR
ncbi:MAG: ABC transporter substrate-binding protein [Planctomycetes bacterium]|nr:ABC transporter substrate-binding protein [Planctomycetota bacterium]